MGIKRHNSSSSSSSNTRGGAETPWKIVIEWRKAYNKNTCKIHRISSSSSIRFHPKICRKFDEITTRTQNAVLYRHKKCEDIGTERKKIGLRRTVESTEIKCERNSCEKKSVENEKCIIEVTQISTPSIKFYATHIFTHSQKSEEKYVEIQTHIDRYHVRISLGDAPAAKFVICK